MKHLLLNKDNVIIDIVDTVKPVMKNKNGITVLCKADEAQGYIGSDNDTIYAKIGSQFQPTYYDIAKAVSVGEIPALVVPLMFKYGFENAEATEMTFYMNEDPYPETNTNLTARTTDIEDMILDMSMIVYA